MSTHPFTPPTVLTKGLLALTASLLTLPVTARVLDDFNDNTKTGWTDFTFVKGVGLPVEQDGKFSFAIPGAVLTQVGSGLFSASTKSTETFTLQEGRTVEFRVDVVKGGAKDSFAVLSFIPASSSGPGQLKGYSIAKSTTDVLLVKGINQYFVADSGAAANLKQENITLVLSLTGKGGNVIINGKVLDKDANNAVIWEKTVVDTPAADVMADGTDNPAAPFLGSGNFVLYLYADYDKNAVEDPYQVTYDNAEVYVTDTAVLDDFNDNTKTGWTDFTFVKGVGLPVEQDGKFSFAIPGAVLTQVGSGLFSASTKTTRTFDIVEGERIVFQVDVVKGGAKDSFAVLSFIPSSSAGPGQLKGYSLAKSTTDVLLVKGINQYFVADAGAAANLKQDNITLILSLTGKGGNVIINGKVLDKDANDAVIWEKTVVDTPAADVMADGTDNPAAPFLGSGNFVLYLYADFDRNAVEDPYQVTYDNAVVSAPPQAANIAPIISEVQPAEFGNFLPASTQISFKVTDDKALDNDKISVTLNGTNYTTTNGLTVTGAGSTKTATLSGLGANVNYTAVLQAQDAEGLTTKRTLYFDTFLASDLTIEIEDYNFEGGRFIDNPVPVTEGGFDAKSYSAHTGVTGVDYNETRATPNNTDTKYRPDDPIRMGHTRDLVRAKYTAAGGAAADVYDYDVGDIAAGEWLNFTRTFPAGSYEVYLREALANVPTGESVLEQVTGDPSKTDQTTKVLGSFLGVLTGFQYRNFALTDGSGLTKVVLRLEGLTTLRLRQVTPDPGDGLRLENYMIFVPVADIGSQRATVSSVAPAPESTVETAAPTITVVIQNRDTSVNTNTIKLQLNGATVVATVVPGPTGATVSYVIAPLPVSGATNNAVLSFKDNQGADVSTAWRFVVSYKSLDAANRRNGTGQGRGFTVRMVQAPEGSNLENSLARAELQLAPNSTIPVLLDTNVVLQTVNMAQDDRGSGFFPNEDLVPGLSQTGLTDDFAVEVLAYLDLPAGVQRFGVVSDDGYKVASGAALKDLSPSPLGFHNGGPANETFDFVVPVAGLYPFRMVWYERGGNAYAEWFSVELASGERTLINDPAAAKAIKAYVDFKPAAEAKLTVRKDAGNVVIEWSAAGYKLQDADAVAGPWNEVPGATSPKTVAPQTKGKFYRLKQ